MDNNNDSLLYGKSGIKHLVGIETEDDGVHLFIQNMESGEVEEQIKPHRYWLLSNRNIDGKFTKLEGNLHYCWGRQFATKEDFMRHRGMWRKYDTYSIYNSEEAAMCKDGYTFFRDMKPSDVSLLSFDIETTGLDGYADDAKILLISTTHRNTFGESVNKLFSYDEYESEADMLLDFFAYVREKDPSLLVGHNIITYDFCYIQARCEINNVPFIIGRNDSEVKFNTYESKFRLDGTRDLLYKNVHVWGRSIVDTFLLAIKYDIAKQYESYALKPLIRQMGLEKQDRQYYDAGSIRDNYKNLDEWKKIKSYAEADAEDAVKLWDAFGTAQFYWSQYVSRPFGSLLLSATGSQINNMMVRSYLQNKHSIPKADESGKFSGAISYGKPGIYKNCVRWDVSSLYPSIILTYNVCNFEKDPQGNFLKICKSLTEERLKNKQLAKETGDSYYDDLQGSQKIGINSMYGFMGAPGLNFNSLKHADMITTKGREILQTAIKWATGKDYEKELHIQNNQLEDE